VNDVCLFQQKTRPSLAPENHVDHSKGVASVFYHHRNAHVFDNLSIAEQVGAQMALDEQTELPATNNKVNGNE